MLTKIDHWESEAKKGNPNALYWLGEAYLVGEELPKDKQLGETLWEEAIKTDCAPALRRIGQSYIYGRYVAQNIVKGIGLLKRAAELGSPEASRQLQRYLKNSEGELTC